MRDDPKFIVNSMLGSMARWLRILGYDTVYSKDAEDWQILGKAESENRVIITRDRGLHNRALKRGLKSILLWEDDMADRLAHIASVTGIRLYVDLNYTRCPEDNNSLVKVDKERVKGRVPEIVYRYHSDFWVCGKCGKVYWIGRHWRMIDKILSEARKKTENLKRQIGMGVHG